MVGFYQRLGSSKMNKLAAQQIAVAGIIAKDLTILFEADPKPREMSLEKYFNGHIYLPLMNQIDYYRSIGILE